MDSFEKWFFGVSALLIVLICALAVWWESYSCHSQARLMGFNADWGFTTGCMIEVTPGQWVPLRSYRVID